MKKFLFIVSLSALLALTGCKGKTDADLSKEAGDKVKAVSGASVAVKDGVATLTGEVATEADKTKAAELAKVEGIKEVKNDLKVKPAPTPMATPDAATKKVVEEALKKKGFNDVTADVTDKIKLMGSVAKGKKMEAQATASEAGKKPADASALTEK